jgi:hypothetical protein
MQREKLHQGTSPCGTGHRWPKNSNMKHLRPHGGAAHVIGGWRGQSSMCDSEPQFFLINGDFIT